jgi:hypothetical protein
MTPSIPNENGVYEPTHVEIVAACGRAHAEIRIALCDDGLYRFATAYEYSYGGALSPISEHGDDYPTLKAARVAAIDSLHRYWPKASPTAPASVHKELRDMRAQIEQRVEQPSFL